MSKEHTHICGEKCSDGNCTGEGLDYNEVTLEDVTEENLTTVMKLKVTEEQSDYVAPNSVSVAQGCYSKTSWYKAICYDRIPIGFVMIDIDREKSEYFLWRYMIDERFQSCGIGNRGLEILVEYLRNEFNAKELLVSAAPGEHSPIGFYEKFGFINTGKVEYGEEVLLLNM